MTSCLLSFLLCAPLAGGVEYFGNPTLVTVRERGATERFAVVQQGRPLRAQITGPATVHIDVRVPLRRAQKRSKPFTIRVVVDTIELNSFPVETRQAARPAQGRFVGPGAPAGTVPSAGQRLSVPADAGTAFFEFHLAGSEKTALLLITTAAKDAASPAAAPGAAAVPPMPGLPAESSPAAAPGASEPPGSTSTPLTGSFATTEAQPLLPPGAAVEPGGQPPAPGTAPDAEPAPLLAPGDAAATQPPTAENVPAAERVKFFGTTDEVRIEEMGEEKLYRGLSPERVLRAEIRGPGSLMVGVRVAVPKSGEPKPVTIHLQVDGADAGTQTVTPKEAPSFAATRFASGGPAKTKPSAEEWFTVEMGPGTAFCELSLGKGDKAAFVSLELTPSEAPTEGKPAARGKPMLLSRERIEELQRKSVGAQRAAAEVEAGWRFALELAGGGAMAMAQSSSGWGARFGMQVTPPWLGRYVGLSLSGGLARVSNSVTAAGTLVQEPVRFKVQRERQLIPLEAGLHFYAELSRRTRLLVEGGGGLYRLSLTTTVLSARKKHDAQRFGAWAATRLGVVLGPGALFLGGRYFYAQPVRTPKLTVDMRTLLGELAYVVAF